jgi:hypothetical protein
MPLYLGAIEQLCNIGQGPRYKFETRWIIQASVVVIGALSLLLTTNEEVCKI